jgi:two-component system OmpR family sensor kinase
MIMRRSAVQSGLDADLRRTARRIGLQTGFLLVLCLLVVGAVAYWSVLRSQEQQMSQTLSAAAQAAGRGGDADHDHDLSLPRGGVQTAVLDSRGLQPSTDMPDGLPDLDLMRQVAASRIADRRTVHLPAGPFEVLTTVRGDDVVQAVASGFEQHQERERVLGALGLAAGAGLVLATLAAAVLARRAVRPMARALELQRRFVADAGHELRTPLTLLSTRAQLLARRVDGRTPSPSGDRNQLVARDAEGIVADSAALTAILEELLLAADVRTPIPQEPIDLQALVRSVVASAQATAERAGISLTLTDRHGSATVSAGAPVALSRSITALVDNALGHARSEVTVSVRGARHCVEIDVTDDGPGIPDETLPRMFSRFASDRPQTAAPGRRHFGLGLALVSEIATRHGGSVTATNRQPPASGAVLRLTIPR